MKCLEPFLLSKLRGNRVLFIVLLFTFIFINLLEAKITIELYPIVNLEKENVLLRDISSIKSESTEDRMKKFIEEIYVTNIDVGIKKIDKEDVIRSLKRNYIDLKNISIIGADRVIVKRETIKLTQAQILKDIEKYLEKNFKDAIEIVSISVSKKELILPSGKIEKKIRVKSKTANNIYLSYNIFINGEKRSSLPITVKVKYFLMIPYAKKDIPKGKKIEPNDVYLKKSAVSNVLRNSVKLEDILGKVAKRNIKKDSIIKSYLLSPDYLVLKGKNVKILYSNGPINIELMGLALENGSKGDIIRVKNISSNKVIKCKVVAPFVVKYTK